jgi:prepilin-type processing-associated H-X9-DG protein/prepilin-type N-terminal cleavage/methylation domain-containing protein
MSEPVADQRSVPVNSSVARGAGPAKAAFTLVELLVVIGVIAILASLALPPLARARSRGQSTYCLNNLRQFGMVLHLYAGDHEDALPYNMGRQGTRQTIDSGEFLNWVNNVMSWELDPDNTNTMLLTTGGLGPYFSGATSVHRCPSDNSLSTAQRQAGWTERTRSISMNAMLGNAGEFLAGAVNTNNPGYRQFFRMSDVPMPAQIFAFVEEHPDSINDGYFINRFYSSRWNDLPASYHNGGANFTFADGHAEFRRWVNASTMPPSRPDAANLPFEVSNDDNTDLKWVLQHTSVLKSAPSKYSYRSPGD